MNGPLLELVTRLAVITALVTVLGIVLRYIWKSLVDRVQALETWRTNHESGHVNVLLELQELKLQAKGTREVVDEVKGLLSDLSAIVNLRRPTRRPRTAGAPG